MTENYVDASIRDELRARDLTIVSRWLTDQQAHEATSSLLAGNLLDTKAVSVIKGNVVPAQPVEEIAAAYPLLFQQPEPIEPVAEPVEAATEPARLTVEDGKFPGFTTLMEFARSKKV